MIDFDKYGLNDVSENYETEEENDGILEQTFDDVVEEVDVWVCSVVSTTVDFCSCCFLPPQAQNTNVAIATSEIILIVFIFFLI